MSGGFLTGRLMDWKPTFGERVIGRKVLNSEFVALSSCSRQHLVTHREKILEGGLCLAVLGPRREEKETSV